MTDAEPPPPTCEPKLRVISYNILYDDPRWGEDWAWDRRAAAVCTVLDRHTPDLIGLQEVLDGQYRQLQAALPGYGVIGRLPCPEPQPERPWCMNPIFFRLARLEPLEHGRLWLSACRPDGVPLLGWPETRAKENQFHHAVWCVFQDRQTGAALFHLNSHWPLHASVYPKCARLLEAAIETCAGGLPSVLTGDFNHTANPFDERTSLADARAVAEVCRGPSGSRVHRQTAQVIPGSAIDHVFIGPGVRALRFETVADSPKGRYPSDHLPIACDLLIGRPDGMEADDQA